MNTVSVVREGSAIRRFECPNCDYVHVFSPKESSKFKKRVVGFTCPRCGYKVTDKDIIRRRGKGPKPPGERRNRRRRPEELVKSIDITPKRNLLDTGIIDFRVKEPMYMPSEAGHPAARGRGYSSRRNLTSRPTDRTLEEAMLVGMNIVPSAPIPEPSLREKDELENLKEKRKTTGSEG